MVDLTQEQKIALLDEVMQDKPLYRQIVRKVAEKHPETYVPEIELGNEIETLRTQGEQRIKALEDQLQAERDARIAAEAVSHVKQEHGLDDAGLKEVTDFMAENHIADLDAGLKFKSLSDNASQHAGKGPLDRSTMHLPEGFVDALKDRRGTRRKNLYQGLADVQRAQARAERLAVH